MLFTSKYGGSVDGYNHVVSSQTDKETMPDMIILGFYEKVFC